MKPDQLPGLTPLWLISLALVLGVVLVTAIPFILSGQAINRPDLVGFAGNVVSGLMTLAAAVLAWFAVKRQINASKEIALIDRSEAWETVRADLENAIAGIEVLWMSVDHAMALPNTASLKAHERRLTNVVVFSSDLPDPAQVDAIDDAAKLIGAARRRRLGRVTFILRELIRKADDFGRGPTNGQPKIKWRSARLGTLRTTLTIFYQALVELDPALARPLASRTRADLDTETRRDRLLQLWAETVEWENTRND